MQKRGHSHAVVRACNPPCLRLLQAGPPEHALACPGSVICGGGTHSQVQQAAHWD